MFWADKLLEKRTGKEIINDSFTPSGIVHMGSLKGPVIHDVLYRILKEKNSDVSFMYGFDDMDPIDGLAPDLQKTHEQYLGIPIAIAPSPDGNGSFGDYFDAKMKSLLTELGIKPDRMYKTSQLYKNGDFNKAIQFVLDNASKVREVYGKIYKKVVPDTWYPMQVICPNCGKLGTTKVTGWDGKEVTFSCEENMVKWAEGCGASGKVSPFNGNGKMPWKVEWAAKWWTFGVTIEGAGKDHSSAGGSYDVAMTLVKDVFHAAQPMKLAYEFFLSGGKKMSSSKGLGLTGELLLEVLAPEVARFLMIKTPPNQAIEFTPKNTDVIPKLYDDYQKASDAYFNEKDKDLLRIFELSQINGIKKPPKIRFSVLSQWVQMPNMQQKIKEEGLEEWARYARVWVEKYASESERFSVLEKLPEQVKDLSKNQKIFLIKLASNLEQEMNAEELQVQMYNLAKELNIPTKDAFSAVYTAFIGKNHGPKAAWLIASLDKEFVKKRFKEASSSESMVLQAKRSNLDGIATDSSSIHNDNQKKINSEIFSISSDVKDKFPSISVGIAIIKGVSIERSSEELEKEKEELLQSLHGLTTEQIGTYPEILSYRRLYKETGIDWHSRRPSPEALLRRVALNKGLYTVNTCVDAYNLIVMKNRVSIGAFDLDKIVFPTMLRMAKTGEEILLLGDQEPTMYKEGEIAYFDQKGGFNMDFNYRDAQRTAVQHDTKNLYINVDGIYHINPQKVEEVLREACDIIIKHCGGKLELFGIETA